MTLKKYILSIIFSLLSVSIYAATDVENNIHKLPAKGTVALTFDDGPSEIYTPQILAILKKYNIKATFFMVGSNAKSHPDMVKRVLAEGHAINSHTQTHPMLTHLNDKQLKWEVTEPTIIIYHITGKKIACLRYPFGASNEHVRAVIREAGLV